MIGVNDPNEGIHFCRLPVGVFHRRWSVWQCPTCGKLWRKERPNYGDTDQWTYHEYYGTKGDGK